MVDVPGSSDNSCLAHKKFPVCYVRTLLHNEETSVSDVPPLLWWSGADRGHRLCPHPVPPILFLSSTGHHPASQPLRHPTPL